MLLRAPARSGREHERKVTDDGRCGRHQNRTKPRACRLNDRGQLVPSDLLKMIRKLNDEDAVLGDQAHQCDQPDLAIDVERRQAEE